MAIPKNELPSQFINGLYVPAFMPEDLALNEFIEDRTERAAEVQQEVERKVAIPAAGNTPVPLTEEEAAEVDQQIQDTLTRIQNTMGRITTIKERIAEAAAPADSKELSFTLNISKKRRIKRAVQKIFGVKTNTITYTMYRQAIEARRELERQQTKNYVQGRPDAS